MSTDKTEWEFEKRVEGKNIHSVYTLCNECHTWGINLPFNHQCGNCNTTDTTLYFDIETINQEISQALQQEREKCRDIFMKNIDWAEWAMDEIDAGEKFDEAYEALYPSKEENT